MRKEIIGEKVTNLKQISSSGRLAVKGTQYHPEIYDILNMPAADKPIPKIEKFFLRQDLHRWMSEGRLFKLKTK